MAINILSDELVSQIAAGEVIERPSAVIKELVENSLDSGANRVDIEIEESGIKKILVRDDGDGISKEDLLFAPVRHATSKIKNFNDLYKINSFGFRGEALASIFSVAKTTIKSKTKDSNVAYEISSMNLQKVEECSHPHGTSVLVENLFEKTPARKKYLKSQSQELREIIEVVKRFEVINFEKIITLKHNGKFLINKPKLKSLNENLVYVLDKNLKNSLFEINKNIDGIKIKGFIANPSVITYSFKKNQFFYVNNRFVKSKLLNDSVYEGFSTNLMEGRHPFFVVFIEVDPEIIDVNVHPTKIEVKFENELEIYEVLRLAIKEIFESEPIFKPFQREKVVDLKLSDMIDEVDSNEKRITKKDKKYFQEDFQKEFNFLEEKKSEYLDISESQEKTKKEIFKGPLYAPLKDFKVIGQLHKTFIIVETPDEMLVVDQHVAEEKFYFEKMRENFNSKEPQKQMLLKAKIVDLNKEEFLLFEENRKLIEKIGFECEEFGARQILVRAVPKGIRGEFLEPEIIIDILEQISITGKSLFLEEKNENKLASMSCRHSIKAGDELTRGEMIKTVESLRYLKEPFNCPHGRPVLLRYSFNELEKMFKRH